MVDEEMGMPAKRELSMRQLRHLLRLHHGGVSAREADDGGKTKNLGDAWPPGRGLDLGDDIAGEMLPLPGAERVECTVILF